MTFRRYALAVSAVVLGVLPVIACGSDRPGLTTAPSSALSTAPIEQSVISAAETSAIVITSLVPGTSCPALQFKINTYLIKTDATTKYEGGSCASLQAGTKLISLNGSRPNSNELVFHASQITIQQTTPAPTPTPAPASVQTDGTVTSVIAGSACPYREFMVGSYRLTTSALTRYENGSCADIKPGIVLRLSGTKPGDDHVLASRVSFPD